MVTIIWRDATKRRAALQCELDRITQTLQTLPDVREAWIFGSVVHGDVHSTSDLDIFVIRETDEPPAGRGCTLWHELQPKVLVDLFVYTPEEAAEGGRFLRTVKQTGRRIK